MTRRLIILRHAKSSWTSGAPTDHARPLNSRGRRDAPRVGARLRDMGWIPDQVIASDSERTRETWQRMAEAFPQPIEPRFTHDFYHGGISAIRKHCSTLGDAVSTVLVLGHNPGWEGAVERLSGQWARMTTANAALLESTADCWETAMEHPWKLVGVIRPKEL